ncbi:MAG: chitobiase/beta-hexosaminidase C-terminal domain-containing protein, partial [Anaerohalosphaeraceae bacterium]
MCFVVFSASIVYGDGSKVIYVNASATGANTGESWVDAYTSLQMALDMSAGGTEIWVAAGTYKPTKVVGGTGERFKSFQLKNEVSLYGGFNGTEVSLNQRNWTVNKSILSGDLNRNDNDNLSPSEPTRQDNCYHVFNHLSGTELNASAVLDGFTVSGGNGTGSYYYGGGMYNDHCSPTITHCTFQSNSSAGATFGGGAILNYNKSNPMIDHCVFTRNYSSVGGGIYNSSGSNPKILNCTFHGNSASDGGGIYNNSSNSTIADTFFIGNVASAGGGMYNRSFNSTVTNCIFADNVASSGGGMFNNSSSIKIINSIFSGNSSEKGGAIYNGSYSPVITSCTIFGNSSTNAGGAMYNYSASPVITNSILWGNTSLTGAQIYQYSNASAVSYCNVQGGWTGTGNINLYPLFVDAANGDLRLQYDSPCIDAGNNASIPAGMTRDLAGNSRIADGNNDGLVRVDMGAYEINIPANMVLPPTFAPSGGVYNTEQSIVITCGTPNAEIHYTTNGKEPTENDPVIASGSRITVDRTMTLKAKAWKEPMIASMVRSATYSLTVSTPAFSIGGGTYNTEQTVTVTCATPGAMIYYTTNGNDPTENDPAIISGSTIYVDRTLPLKAQARKGTMTPSEIRSATYSLVVLTPVISVSSGTYNSEQMTKITCATPGATIHYTTNGNEPTENDPVIESGSSLKVDRSMTLNVKAWKGAMTPSEKVSVRYNLVVSAPSLSKASGTYNTEQVVEVYCSTPGVVIHYTTNGMNPTEADPVIASRDHIVVDRSLVIKTRAWKGMMNPSDIISATYKIMVAAPSISVGSGTYTIEQTPVISCATPGATIHYTTNGNEPTENDPVIASDSSVSINCSQTLKARAWKGLMNPSDVATAVYQLATAMPEFTPDGNAFSEDQQVTITCATPGAAIYYTLDGSDPLQTGIGIEHGGKIIVAIEPATTLKAVAYKPDFLTSNIRTAVYRQTHIVYVNAQATGSNTGASWTDAYPSLQTALDKAVPGDEIWVAAGTYKPTKMVGGSGNRFKAFQMKNEVGLYGGFNGTEIGRNQRNWDLNKTILSGDLNGDDNSTLLPTEPTRQENCHHVFNHLFGTALNRSAVLDGFIITGGNGNVYPHHYGGGMYNDQCSPTVRRCTFIENIAWWMSGTQRCGGAMMNYNNSLPLIDSCTFIRN